MPDKPISDLPVAISASAGDFFIINEDNTTTKRIDYDNLQKALGGAGGGFAPIHVKIDGDWNSPEITRTIGTVGGAINDGSDIYANVLSGVAPVNVTMPAGADRAVIVYETVVRLLSRVGNPSDSNSHCTYQVAIQIDNATTTNQVVTNRIKITAGQHMPHPATTGSGDYIGKFQEVSRLSKSAILNFTDGATVTFTPECRLIKAKQGYFQVEAGRVYMFPYNSANIRFSTYADSLVSTTSDDDIDPPAITDQERESLDSKELKERMLFLLQAIDVTLQYDAGFDTEFPPSTDTGVPGGTGTNGNMTPRELLQDTAEGVLAIKRNPSLGYEQMTTELDSLQNQASPYVAFKFDWQVNSFASFF